jgi:transcriptional antiterminator NusG
VDCIHETNGSQYVHSSVDGHNSDSASWYAVRTRAKHEKSVSALLKGKGYDHLLPLYQSWHRSSGRIKGVLLPLFKGYLFCRFDPCRRLPILMTPGVSSIVGRGSDPEPISSDEIARIQAACASGLQLTPWPYLERGDVVLVECGPLQGIEGVFVTEKNTCRLVVSVEILRRSVAVEVDRNWVRPIAMRGGAAFSNFEGSRPVCPSTPATPSRDLPQEFN